MNNIFCGIEKLSLVDFDKKLSCVLFISGCNFKCPFCHNSSLMNVTNDNIDFNEIKDYLIKRKKMIDAVVITGGEPTLRKELPSIIKEIKDLGYLIKLDTNGTNPTMLKQLIDDKLIDYVAMDIKTGISNYHIVCGVSANQSQINIAKIKESINVLKSSNINYEFRTTLVKEYHSKDIILEMKELVDGAPKLFLQKFILRDACLDQSLHEVPYEVAIEYIDIFKQSVKEIKLRGY